MQRKSRPTLENKKEKISARISKAFLFLLNKIILSRLDYICSKQGSKYIYIYMYYMIQIYHCPKYMIRFFMKLMKVFFLPNKSSHYSIILILCYRCFSFFNHRRHFVSCRIFPGNKNKQSLYYSKVIMQGKLIAVAYILRAC